jgi:hypothetical protein
MEPHVGHSSAGLANNDLRVSGFSLEPTNIITAPIIIFNASANGMRRFDNNDDPKELAIDKRCIAISGDHAPIINPPL